MPKKKIIKIYSMGWGKLVHFFIFYMCNNKFMTKKRKKEIERALAQIDSKRRRGILDGPFIQKQAEKKEGVAFIIKDVYNGDLEIKESANAWWMEGRKLVKSLKLFLKKRGKKKWVLKTSKSQSSSKSQRNCEIPLMS